MQALSAAALALTGMLSGCRSVPASPTPPRLALEPPAPAIHSPQAGAAEAPHSVPPQAQELPARWAVVALADFGRLVDEAFPRGERRTFVPSAFEELSSALAGHDPIALRAALLLAHCADPLAGELLLKRLERRASPAPGDALGNALEIPCAAALLAFPETREVGPRLEALSQGRASHPDLEVRVECARTALLLGRDGPAAFLISILKHGTHLGSVSAGWTPLEDMGFCQRRAAEALCQRAGRVCRYRPLEALDEREAEIRALEAAFAPARLKQP